MTAQIKKNLTITLIILGVLILGIIGIFAFTDNLGGNKDTIITTNFSNYSIAKDIAGDDYEIVFLGEGQEIHDFEPTAKDIIEINNAEFIILNGSIDSWMDEIIENNNIDNDKVIKFIDQEDVNPHIWLSPKQVISKINTIGETLDLNTNDASKEIIDLDIEYNKLSECSAKNTFSADNTVEYIGLDYGFDIGILPEENNISDVTEIIEDLNQSDNKFILNGENLDAAETISDETGAEIITIDIMEDKTSDSSESNADILRDNLEKIKTSLNC